MTKYYIFDFCDNNAGDQLRSNLSGYPNGTVFINPPLYVNSKKNVWITYPRNDNPTNIFDSIKWIEETGGAKVIPTDITKEICVPPDITRNNNEPKTKQFNTQIINMFKKFACHLEFN